MNTRLNELTVVLAILMSFMLLAVLTINLRSYMQEQRAQVAAEQAAPPAVSAHSINQP